jgi:hypothetical protein
MVLLALASSAAASPSTFLKVELAGDPTAVRALSVDSLGKGKLGVNLLREPAVAAGWKINVSERRLALRPEQAASTLALVFDNTVCHATLLGHMNSDGSVRLPALLHLPDFGTFRITAVGKGAGNLSLGYDANRNKGGNFVKVVFPAAPMVRYIWEVVAIYAGPAALANDPRFDGYRRNFLNIFQLNPRVRALANHAASDPCALTVYEYAEMAVYTPPLAPGVNATDLVRLTLDRYLAGMKSCGMCGYNAAPPGKDPYPQDSLDTLPSLVIAAADYVQATGDRAWLSRNYAGIQAWADKMASYDRDNDGLIESPLSGNEGSWRLAPHLRPANWWDCIGFGHKDAYSNALAYRALQGMARMSQAAGREGDASSYGVRASRLKAAYARTFYNPATGVLAGWVSADGKVHDYYFTFVAGLAISSDLVPADMANRVMDHMLAKIKGAGYTRFEFGLPGNLTPIRRDDYTDGDNRFGGSKKEDGSDGFQIYENGGASACHVYWTLQALYKLGRRKDAEAILFPLLEGFEKGNFQGRAPKGLTNDWRAWDGAPHGYEGLLVDNFLALLAVYTGHLGK